MSNSFPLEYLPDLIRTDFTGQAPSGDLFPNPNKMREAVGAAQDYLRKWAADFIGPKYQSGFSYAILPFNSNNFVVFEGVGHLIDPNSGDGHRWEGLPEPGTIAVPNGEAVVWLTWLPSGKAGLAVTDTSDAQVRPLTLTSIPLYWVYTVGGAVQQIRDLRLRMFQRRVRRFRGAYEINRAVGAAAAIIRGSNGQLDMGGFVVSPNMGLLVNAVIQVSVSATARGGSTAGSNFYEAVLLLSNHDPAGPNDFHNFSDYFNATQTITARGRGGTISMCRLYHPEAARNPELFVPNHYLLNWNGLGLRYPIGGTLVIYDAEWSVTPVPAVIELEGTYGSISTASPLPE